MNLFAVCKEVLDTFGVDICKTEGLSPVRLKDLIDAARKEQSGARFGSGEASYADASQKFDYLRNDVTTHHTRI